MEPIKLTVNDLKYILNKAGRIIIDEAYGISEIVSVESANVLKEINRILLTPNVVVNQEQIPETNGLVTSYEFAFRMMVFDEFHLGVDFMFRIADSFETVKWCRKKKYPKDQLSFNGPKRIITLNLLSMHPGFDGSEPLQFPLAGELLRLIEHEMKHAYQYYMKRGMFSDKAYDSERRMGLYNKIKQEMSRYSNPKDDEGILKRDIAHCLYQSFKTEQTAHERELYRQILNSGVQSDGMWDFVKTTTYYDEFTDYKTLLERRKGYEETLNSYMKATYGKTFQWFQHTAENCVKDMRRVMNKAIWQAMIYRGADFGLPPGKTNFLI